MRCFAHQDERKELRSTSSTSETIQELNFSGVNVYLDISKRDITRDNIACIDMFHFRVKWQYVGCKFAPFSCLVATHNPPAPPPPSVNASPPKTNHVFYCFGENSNYVAEKTSIYIEYRQSAKKYWDMTFSPCGPALACAHHPSLTVILRGLK